MGSRFQVGQLVRAKQYQLDQGKIYKTKIICEKVGRKYIEKIDYCVMFDYLMRCREHDLQSIEAPPPEDEIVSWETEEGIVYAMGEFEIKKIEGNMWKANFYTFGHSKFFYSLSRALSILMSVHNNRRNYISLNS